jgi:hypothetical protein
MTKKVIGGYAYNAALAKIREAVSVALIAVNRLSEEQMGPQMRATQFVKVAMALNDITQAVMDLDSFSQEIKTGQLTLDEGEEEKGEQ